MTVHPVLTLSRAGDPRAAPVISFAATRFVAATDALRASLLATALRRSVAL